MDKRQGNPTGLVGVRAQGLSAQDLRFRPLDSVAYEQYGDLTPSASAFTVICRSRQSTQ
jgi:hypothetical protein